MCRDPRKKIRLFAKEGQHRDLARLFFSRLNPLIKFGSNECRSDGLGVLAQLLQLQSASSTDGSQAPIEEELSTNQSILEMFDDSDKKALSLFHAYARVPMLEISSKAYCIFMALSQQAWALKKFQNCPGLIEFMLDRQIMVSDKFILETKYAIIKNCYAIGSAEDIFPPDVLFKMKKYVDDGPFYSSDCTQVALDV